MATGGVALGKTGEKTGHFAPGHDARRGGGKAGRSGRKPIAFKQECERLTSWALLEKIEPYLQGSDPSDAGFRWAMDWLSRYSAPSDQGELTTTHERALQLLA